MARYIDIDELMKLSQDIATFDMETQTFGCFSGISDEDINTLATADVVEVVRCKDCTEWDKNECECSHWYGFRENDFCSYGERRTDDAG